MDLDQTDDEVYPTKTHPGAMDFDAPMHVRRAPQCAPTSSSGGRTPTC